MLACVMLFSSAGNLSGKDSSESAKKKRIYITNIKGDGVKKQVLDRLRNGIFNSILTNYGDKYSVIDDEAVKTLYSQAEKMLASGCDDASCVKDIATNIKTDIIIYGEASIDNGEIRVNIRSMWKDAKSDEYSNKPTVDATFRESQVDWFSSEIGKKVVDQAYKFDPSKAPVEYTSKIEIQNIAISGADSFNIEVLKFKTDDQAIQNILGYLKEVVQEGDEEFVDGDYEDAIDEYNLVIERIDSKLRPESREKMKAYRAEVVSRIDTSYAMIYKEEMEKIDKKLKGEDDADESFVNKMIGKYRDIKADMKEIPQHYFGENSKKISKALDSRVDSCFVSICTMHEKIGDTAYSEYKFDRALDEYNTSLNIAGNITGTKKTEIMSRYTSKISVTYTTGKSYMINKVISYTDRAEYYNVQDKTSKAEDMLEDARDFMTGGMHIFITDEAIFIYNNLAELLKIEQITSETEPELFKTMSGADGISNKYRDAFIAYMTNFSPGSESTGNDLYGMWIDSSTYAVTCQGVANGDAESHLRKKTALTSALMLSIYRYFEKFEGKYIKQSDYDKAEGLVQRTMDITVKGIRIESFSIVKAVSGETGTISIKMTLPDKTVLAMSDYVLLTDCVINMDKLYGYLKLLPVKGFKDVYDRDNNCEIVILFNAKKK